MKSLDPASLLEVRMAEQGFDFPRLVQLNAEGEVSRDLKADGLDKGALLDELAQFKNDNNIKTSLNLAV